MLFDDREEKPGVKFKDADLIGLPLRVTVSPRALEQGGVELKHRNSQKRMIVPRDHVISVLQTELAVLHRQIKQTLGEVPFKG